MGRSENPATYDPAKHCGAARRSTDKFGTGHKGDPCLQPKGAGTDHTGFGYCRLHMGSTQDHRTYAAREQQFAENLDAFASLTLTQIADRLARVAAAQAMSSPLLDVDRFSTAVSAFSRAAERAEGSKVTLEGKVQFLSALPETELDAAITEVERIIAKAREAA